MFKKNIIVMTGNLPKTYCKRPIQGPIRLSAQFEQKEKKDFC